MCRWQAGKGWKEGENRKRVAGKKKERDCSGHLSVSIVTVDLPSIDCKFELHREDTKGKTNIKK